jgi:LysM repeat protein
MELLKKSIHTQRVKTKTVLQVPLETDINVSDTKPDVSKVIYNNGRIKVDEIKTGMNKIWVKGKLCYKLLYQALDNEETLAGMDGEIPFMEEIYLDRQEEIIGQDRVICRTSLDDMKIQLINSRKLSIRSVITIEPRVEESVSRQICTGIEISSDDDMAQQLEYRKKNIDYLETLVQKKDLVRVSEETKLPAGMAQIDVALWKNVDLVRMNFRPSDEKLTVNGDFVVFIVYKEETGNINWYETELPFSANIDCSGCHDGMIADVEYDIGHEEITVHDDSDGEARIINIEMTVELEIKLYDRQSTQVVSDVYGVSCEADAKLEDNKFKNIFAEFNIEEKLSKTLQLDESAPKFMQICHSDAKAMLSESEFSDGKLMFKGDIELQILYASSGDDKGGIYNISETVPFEISRELQQNDEVNIEEYSLYLTVEHQSVSIKDSSLIEWRGTLNLKLIMYNSNDEKIISELNLLPINADVIEKIPGFAIYYVNPGDSLWQIGKKYYVSVQRIKDMNNLTEDEIKPGDKLLIVK